MMVLLAAGGTGGHIMPTLAVATELRRKFSCDLHWIGSTDMEKQLAATNLIDFSRISISGLRHTNLSRKLFYPFILANALRQALVLLWRIKPAAIFVAGGYASVPTALAGFLMGKPIFLHEQNSLFGWASRVISIFARRVYMGFAMQQNKGAKGGKLRDKVLVCGNPSPIETRLKNSSPSKRYLTHQGPLRILVVGGSQGARVFNELLPQALGGDFATDLTVWHLTGKGNLDAVKQAYAENGVRNPRLAEFCDDMAECYEWADLVIARAGAMTISELCLVGVATIFVPFPYATDDHQFKNARSLDGAAYVLRQSDLTLTKLRHILRAWTPGKQDARVSLAQRGAQMQKFAKFGVASRIATDMMKILGGVGGGAHAA